jgi:hypothetical protein
MASRLMSLILKYQSADSAKELIDSAILDIEPSKNSVIALNGLLYDPPSILDEEVMQKIVAVALNAAQSTEVAL